jgi:lysozyme
MSRIVNAAALAIIKGAEGCRLHAYLCPAGIATIGYGHTGPEVHLGLVWTQAQADAALQQDVAVFADGITHAVGTEPTSGNMFGAMTSLAYNIGLHNFRSSSVLRFHLQGLHHEAAQAFNAWNKGGGRALPGLVARRAAESALYLRPDA